MKHRLNKTALSWAVGLALGTAPGALLAAGFYLQEQSVSGLGRAFAGEAAIASDASTIYFNPAGMTRLEAAELQAAVHLLVPKASVTDGGSTFNGMPYTGGSGGIRMIQARSPTCSLPRRSMSAPGSVSA